MSAEELADAKRTRAFRDEPAPTPAPGVHHAVAIAAVAGAPRGVRARRRKAT